MQVNSMFIVSLFLIWGPLFAFGWAALDFKSMAVFLAAYIFVQNLPNFFCMTIFESWIAGKAFRCMKDYVTNFRVIQEAELDPEQCHIIGWHPHGRVFIGVGVFTGQLFEWFPKFKKAGRMIHVAVNDAMFMIPFIGYWLYLLGQIPVNKYSLKATLKRGDSVVIVVGGIEEVLLGTFDDKDVLYLNKRKGFCKIAIESGAGLVPVFCFGENMLFQHSSEASLGVWRWINKAVKLGAPFPVQGRWGLPFMYRRPMMIVFGKPLFAKEGETVSDFHERYVDALQKLYQKYVGQSDDPNRKLVIV